jgi:ABC-type antimicrobial peptide transport system permease subunit
MTQGDGVGSELVVRSTLPPPVLSPSIRARVAAIDPAIVVSEMKPLGALVERAISPRRFLVRLLGGFAGVALLLACLGIYGVVSYTVSQRVQEIGVRLALGATAGDVRRLVLGGTLRLAALGLAAGLLLALLLSRLIATLLYATSPSDAMTFGSVALVLVGVALMAGLAPAWRASRTNPLTALRGD